MTRTAATMIAILCCLAPTACNDDDDAHVQAPVGTWAFGCRPLFPGAWFSGTNTTTETGWEIALAFSSVEDGCAAPAWSFRAHGPYELGGEVATPAGAAAIDFIVTARYLTLHDDAARAILAGVGCDTTGYALGQQVNLNETGCGGFAASLQQCPADYDIFKVEGDTLFIGRRPPGSDICAPERRPTELDRDWPFVRQ